MNAARGGDLARSGRDCRALGCGRDEHRSLDFGEALRVERAVQRRVHLRAHAQVALETRTPQVDVAVPQPQHLVGLDAVVDRERWCLGLVQDLERGRRHLHLTGPESDKVHCVAKVLSLVSMGFNVYTTGGTHIFLKQPSIDTVLLPKVSEGARPNILDKIANGEIQMIFNTPTRKGAATDEGRIRATAVRNNVPMITTITGARAAVQAIAALRAGTWSVAAVQDYFPRLTRPAPSSPEKHADVVVQKIKSQAAAAVS